jgi:hypothetical protein
MNNLIRTGAFFLFAMVVSAFFGIIIPILGPKFSLILLAGFVGSAALFVNSEHILLALQILALCVVGPVNYFGIVNLHWIPYIVGLLLYVKLILEKFAVSQPSESKMQLFSGIQWAMLIFFSILAFSTLLSPPGAHLLLITSKNYFFLWSVFFLLALGHVKPDFFQKAWIAMFGVALMQFPFALYQNLFIAKNRKDNASWDAVVGTFPGLKDWGGDSGGMTVFLLTVFAIALCLWRRKCFRGSLVALVGLATTGTVLLAEVKIVYVLVPIVFVGVYRTELFRNALVSIIGFGLIGILFATVAITYDALTERINTGPEISFTDKIEGIFNYSIATDIYQVGGGIGRGTALAVWWNGNQFSDPNMYIGNGMASSLISQRPGDKGGKIGERYFPVQLDVSSASVLLWEAGIFGLLAFCAILIFGAMEAQRLARNKSIPATNGAILDATPAILAMYLATLFYHKNAIGASEPGQFLLLFFLGHVAYWTRRARSVTIL